MGKVETKLIELKAYKEVEGKISWSLAYAIGQKEKVKDTADADVIEAYDIEIAAYKRVFDLIEKLAEDF